jgi:hypothetical protein
MAERGQVVQMPSVKNESDTGRAASAIHRCPHSSPVSWSEPPSRSEQRNTNPEGWHARAAEGHDMDTVWVPGKRITYAPWAFSDQEVPVASP